MHQLDAVGKSLNMLVEQAHRLEAALERIAGVQVQQPPAGTSAVAAQRGQVLTALRDVEDQLSALRLMADRSEVLAQAVQSAERAGHLSDVRYRNGYVSQLELLDARRNALRQRRNALQVSTAQYTTTVMLIRAIGGSWEQGAV